MPRLLTTHKVHLGVHRAEAAQSEVLPRQSLSCERFILICTLRHQSDFSLCV